MRNKLFQEELYNFLGIPKGLMGRFFVFAVAFVSGGLIWFFATPALEERFLMMENAAARVEILQTIIFVIGWLFGCVVGIVIWNVWLSKRVAWKI
ncbi:MAG: hypothetical protein J5601_05835 [Elusimicrobiaceae bacterium]|nr:hypothetical protein [Elusimicrobiaceae bacterium]